MATIIVPSLLTRNASLFTARGWRFLLREGRRRLKGREDEIIIFETGMERMTIRQMLDEFDRDAADLDALKISVR